MVGNEFVYFVKKIRSIVWLKIELIGFIYNLAENKLTHMFYELMIIVRWFRVFVNKNT